MHEKVAVNSGNSSDIRRVAIGAANFGEELLSATYGQAFFRFFRHDLDGTRQMIDELHQRVELILIEIKLRVAIADGLNTKSAAGTTQASTTPSNANGSAKTV